MPKIDYNFATQSIGLASIPNARDLGGYVLPDGSRIRRGLLLRGGALAGACPEDLAKLKDVFNLSKVFDFRTSVERQLAPDKAVEGAMNLWFPAFDEESQTMQDMSLPHEAYRNLGPWLLVHGHEALVQKVASQMYLSMVCNDFTQVQYAGFLQNIVNTPSGSVYWHCSQGKDRTGLGAALILFALGADRALVMKDFAISAEYYAEELAPYLAQVSTDGEKAVMQTFISVNCRYFEDALDWIEAGYGSFMNFLEGPLCLGLDDIQVLRNRYLE